MICFINQNRCQKETLHLAKLVALDRPESVKFCHKLLPKRCQWHRVKSQFCILFFHENWSYSCSMRFLISYARYQFLGCQAILGQKVCHLVNMKGLVYIIESCEGRNDDNLQRIIEAGLAAMGRMSTQQNTCLLMVRSTVLVIPRTSQKIFAILRMCLLKGV